MARALRVFGMIIASHGDECERLGQPRHSRQVRAVVAATTKKEATALFGITAGEANDYMGETGNGAECEIALSKPGQVFAFPTQGKDVFIEIERKAHVPIKRRKRLSYEEQQALREEYRRQQEARTFTAEEFQHMIEMFAGANHPLSGSIAEKARLNLKTED